MKRAFGVLAVATLFAVAGGFWAGGVTKPSLTKGFTSGAADIKSMSTMTFGPEGLLFIGDSKGGAVYAIDLDDRSPSDNTDDLEILDVEGKIAAMLGTTADEILIHDLAVNPISQNAYVAISRGRGKWESSWYLPNDLEDARVLLRIRPDGKIEEVSLENVSYAKAELPNPVDMNKEHRWKKGATLRADAITDLAYHDGKIYVSGLSNEEFAATMWQIPFPFKGEASYSTLEIFHGAHGKYETHSPIRAFVPYTAKNEPHIFASYLCTPLVSFPLSDLSDGQHVKGKTVAEMGSRNFPLDMVLCKSGDKEFVVMSNSALPLLTFDPMDVYSWDKPITKEVETYTYGVPYVPRSGAGIQQLDIFNSEYLLALQRMPSGKLNLVSVSLKWLAL